MRDEPTVLVQDIKTFLHQQGCIEDYQAIANRQHIIARSGLEEGANRLLLLVSLHAACVLYATTPYQAIELLAVERSDNLRRGCWS